MDVVKILSYVFLDVLYSTSSVSGGVKAAVLLIAPPITVILCFPAVKKNRVEANIVLDVT